MVFCAGITFYHPSKENIERAKMLSSCFDYLLVYDNTEGNINLNGVFGGYPNVLVFSTGKNDGLPVAYNLLFKKASELNVDFFCTLDQDSIFEAEEIDALKHLISNKVDIKTTFIIAPYIDYGFGTFQRKEVLLEKKWVITSGSFVNLKLCKEKNISYDENYFIDKFEIDLCQQAIAQGLKVTMYTGAVLHQRLGDDNGHKHPNHSPIRHYYLFRNRLYFNKKWFGFAKRTFLNFLQTIRHLLLIFLYEDNKRKKIEMFFKAKRDFKNNNMGKASTL